MSYSGLFGATIGSTGRYELGGERLFSNCIIPRTQATSHFPPRRFVAPPKRRRGAGNRYGGLEFPPGRASRPGVVLVDERRFFGMRWWFFQSRGFCGGFVFPDFLDYAVVCVDRAAVSVVSFAPGCSCCACWFWSRGRWGGFMLFLFDQAASVSVAARCGGFVVSCIAWFWLGRWGRKKRRRKNRRRKKRRRKKRAAQKAAATKVPSAYKALPRSGAAAPVLSFPFGPVHCWLFVAAVLFRFSPFGPEGKVCYTTYDKTANAAPERESA